MQEINLSKNFKVKVYDKTNFKNHLNAFTNDCLQITNSYANGTTQQEFDDALKILEYEHNAIFDDERNTVMYIMYKNEQPVCFALYSQVEFTDCYTLEMIHTHKNFLQLGLATAMLRLVR